MKVSEAWEHRQAWPGSPNTLNPPFRSTPSALRMSANVKILGRLLINHGQRKTHWNSYILAFLLTPWWGWTHFWGLPPWTSRSYPGLGPFLLHHLEQKPACTKINYRWRIKRMQFSPSFPSFNTHYSTFSLNEEAVTTAQRRRNINHGTGQGHRHRVMVEEISLRTTVLWENATLRLPTAVALETLQSSPRIGQGWIQVKLCKDEPFHRVDMA